MALWHGAGLGNTGSKGEAAAADAGSDWDLDAGKMTAVGRGEELGPGGAAAAAAAAVVAAVDAGGAEDNRGRTRWTAFQDEAGRLNRRRGYWYSLLL